MTPEQLELLVLEAAYERKLDEAVIAANRILELRMQVDTLEDQISIAASELHAEFGREYLDE